MAHLKEIENRLLTISSCVKEVDVKELEGKVIASIYPDFEALKKRQIINIEEELKWYAVELYNLDPIEGIRLDGYEIVQEAKAEAVENEPDDEVYRELKRYLSSVSIHPVFPSSHLELDLGLDSLEYVMLFMFVEKSYGLHLDEKQFSTLMIMEDLYRWVKEHRKKTDVVAVKWSDILQEKGKEKLIYSPWVMMAWKIVLWPFFKLYFRLKVTGRENLPDAPFIIAPTHYSMLDGFVVLATLPSSVLKKSFFLAYEGEFGTQRLGPVAKHSQMLLIDIDKNLKASLQRTALPLIESQNLVIFPENARSRDGKLLPFKRYYAILAKELNVPIVPVVLDGTFEAMRAGIRFPRPAKVRVKYLSPVYPDGLTYEAINDQVKSAIEKSMRTTPLR
ncbi:MAG: 1-acyl-sn-glycerol-3-phosphate acyltransferase [Campylobacterota bacterium]|nr:1-acyl-sn-glycerol-3-phosphate acyltransferase [Campylobacterota bacterium]